MSSDSDYVPAYLRLEYQDIDYHLDDLDGDVDVCTHCGELYNWTQRMREMWVDHFGDDCVMFQMCSKCISGMYST